MIERWSASGLLWPESGFRRICHYNDLPKLREARSVEKFGSSLFAAPTVDFLVAGRLIARSLIDPDNISPRHSRFDVPSLERIVYAASRQ
jgi:hypothetical protein